MRRPFRRPSRLAIAPLVAAAAAIFHPVTAAALNPPPEIPLDSGLRTIDNHPLSAVLRTAAADVARFGRRTDLPMEYDIFGGRSALRDLPDVDLSLLRPSTFGVVRPPGDPAALRRASAALLLLRGRGDAAHEVLLGVEPTNVDEAEHAATNPGRTGWSDDHPLTTSADLLHAALHRLEGLAAGEGGHAGFDNAKYWLAGGPKGLDRPAPHGTRDDLAGRAGRFAPLLCARRGGGAVVAGPGPDGRGASHRIIADGGKTRLVRVPPGQWDGFAFADVCRLRAEGKLSEEEEQEVAYLQRCELVLLLRAELVDAGFGEEAP